MSYFKDTPPSEHELTSLRLMQAGSPSRWKQTRHRWMLAAGLIAGWWVSQHLAPATAGATCGTPAVHASSHPTSRTTNR